MLERTLPDRFNSQPEAAPAPPPMLDPRTIEILLSAAYKFAKPEPEPGRVIVAEEVKALPAPTDPDPLPAKVRMPPIKPPDGRL